jgi:hypothetical protein
MATSDRDALLLQMSYEVRSLQKSIDKINGVNDAGLTKMEKRAEGAARGVEKALGNIKLPKSLARDFNDLGSDIGRGLGNMSRTAQLALAGISAYAIKLASDAEDINSAFAETFGSLARNGQKAAEKISKDMSRSVTDVKANMNTLQQVLKGLGLDANTAFAATGKLAARGIDLASNKNISDARAQQALLSGLTGETEPLKGLGVVITENTVKAELMRLGFKGNAEQASEGAKTIARLNLILDKTSFAAGDVARTSDGANNKLKELQAQAKTAAEDLGTQLLPAFVSVAGAATDTLKAFNDLPGGVQIAGLAFIGLVAAGGPIAGLILNLQRVIKLAQETRAAIIAASAVSAAAPAAGGAAGAVGGGLAAGGAAVGGAVLVAGAALAGGAYVAVSETRIQAARKRALEDLTKATVKDLELALKASVPARAQSGFNTATATIRAELARRNGQSPETPKPTAPIEPKGGFKLSPDLLKPAPGSPKGAVKATPRDTTQERTASVDGVLAGAARDLLQARLRLTDDVEARAKTERQIVEQELAEDLARLTRQKADLDDDKGISDATRKSLKAKLDEAAVTAKKASGARIDLIDREAAWEAEDRADETRRQIRDAEIAGLQAQLSFATTRAERTRIEAELLRLQQDELTRATAKDVGRQVKTGAITAEDGQRRTAAVAQANNAGKRQFDADHASPLDDYLRSIKDVDTELQQVGVDAFQQLSSGLADAIVNAKSLGDVGSAVFKQIEVQLLDMLIKAAAQNAAGYFGFSGGGYLGGFAGGGRLLSGPGTGTSDSILATNGKGKFARFSDGEFVSTARATQKHRALLEAINSGELDRYATGGLIGSLPSPSGLGVMSHQGSGAPYFDLRHAVVTEALLADINRKIASSERRATVQGSRGGAALARVQAQQAASTRLGY